MDERKKQIEDFERNMRENQAALDSLLERFGESLFSRIGEETPAEGAFAGLGEYRRLQKEIAGFEAVIKTVEEQIRRFRELEENIELKEREDGERAKELAGIYARLGKSLLAENSGAADFAAPFREQAEALVTKVRSLEDRVAELDQKEGGNVFAWIGKSAQGLVLRSFLTKAQENLEQLYRNAGERYDRADQAGDAPAGDVPAIMAEIEKARGMSRLLSEELMKLREEKRAISESFGADGSPLKQIQTLRNNIARIKEELRVLYRHFGSEAVWNRQPFVDTLITGHDQPLLDDASRIKDSVRDAGAAVEKLRAALAIDGEKAKIEKYRKAIEDKRARIAEAEKDIADFEESIRDSSKYIEEMQKLL